MSVQVAAGHKLLFALGFGTRVTQRPVSELVILAFALATLLVGMAGRPAAAGDIVIILII